VRKLFSWRISAKEICNEFWSSRDRRRGCLVRLAHTVHTVVFAATGGGKGVSCIIPFLLTCPDSCVVIDFKGENALKTAKHRAKKFGHRIVLLDPFKIVTQTPDCLNPLDFIDKNSETALDDCNDLAKALIVRTGQEREPHWDDSAESWLAALIATVVHHG
jgi:type IV secretion system protein VirD4